MRTKSTGGFTLIELLIVIAIIGILAAVLIPNLMNARATANLRAAQAHSTNVYTALVANLAERPNDDAAAVVGGVTGSCAAGGTAGAYSWGAAPAGIAAANCTIAASGATDFTVVVTYDGTAFTNGRAP